MIKTIATGLTALLLAGNLLAAEPTPELSQQQLDDIRALQADPYIAVQLSNDQIKLVPRSLVDAQFPEAAMASDVAVDRLAANQRLIELEKRVRSLEDIIQLQTALLQNINDTLNKP
ncbi:hypothetical protein [Gallaecimonas xiamenensis]|uniref:Uncharacterized protein n=1 Tax=Gallaecimonas xiamenensis 3-C-1 TaxID=745411 RepID=K2JLF6_9GAMM|nr:hypothetical protein [Gallaecimonas xiamenensis]EKE76148.1 hypothetical protein B3C1_04550 [Gallaecimonas xiamenensis 3-C-1]